MSERDDEVVDLKFLGLRVQGLADRVHDRELRFTALETRFTSMEVRMGGIERRLDLIEERTSRILAILVRLAERQGIQPGSE